MLKVLVFIEQRMGELKHSSLEALGVAAKIAGSPDQVAGIVMGSASDKIAAATQNCGAAKIYTVADASFDTYNVLSYTDAVCACIDAFGAEVLLGIASPMGRDLLPRVAARKDAGILTDLIDVNFDGGFAGGSKPLYAGKVTAKMKFQGNGLRIASLRPNVFPVVSAGGASVVEPLAVPQGDRSHFKTVEIRKGKSNKTDLTEAVRIISGGRAMANAENFKILDDCAEVIGATVGASRAAVDSGYASHDMQVGQTGKTVNPQLYIACGISGSIQHMAGMRTSKVIVAVNTDADAPIFSIADYGIVADLFEAMPIMQQKLKMQLKG